MIAFSKYRLKTRQQLQGMRTGQCFTKFMVDMVFLALVLLVALGFFAWIDSSIEEAERIGRQYGAAEAESLRNDSRNLAHVMNGGALFNHTEQAAHFFQVSKQKGL